MYRHTTGGDLSSGGQWLRDEGSYHFVITGVDEDVCDKDGRPMTDVAFDVNASVLAGTTPAQEDKIFSFRFFHPKPGSTDDQLKGNKRTFDKFWVATGVLKAEDVLKADQDFDINLQALVGRQFIAKMVKNNNDRLTAWSDFSHVDDPSVAAIPKSASDLKLLPSDQRWVGDTAKKQAEAMRKKPGSATQQTQPAQSQSSGSPAGSGGLSDEELSGI